jgi:hypothetical protein
MTNHKTRNMEDGIALSRHFTRQQLRSVLVMVVSAALAFFVTAAVAPGTTGLGFAIAAATGFSVGVWCQPDTYRRRNGSLALAILLIAGMWACPVVIMLTSFFG